MWTRGVHLKREREDYSVHGSSTAPGSRPKARGGTLGLHARIFKRCYAGVGPIRVERAGVASSWRDLRTHERRCFYARHRALAEPGWFVPGNRILLGPEFTRAALAAGTPVESWSLAALVRERLRGGINRLLPALRLPLGPLRKLNPHTWVRLQISGLEVCQWHDLYKVVMLFSERICRLKSEFL